VYVNISSIKQIFSNQSHYFPDIPCILKVCKSLAYSPRSQWWGCHLSLWTGWFSVGVSAPSLWRSPFSTRQWRWFWSTLGILLSRYPPYLVRLPLSATMCIKWNRILWQWLMDNITLLLQWTYQSHQPWENHYQYDSVEITNKMQLCNRIYYSTVHWRLNMFRAAYHSSSGALF
jgi:hypothetical protein